MNTHLTFGNIKITFLDVLDALSDGGTHFGPVPKAVWNRKFPVNDNNQIPQVIDPILLQYEDKNYLVDTGLGTSKMTEKEMRNAGISKESKLLDSLKAEGVSPSDIHYVVQTHMHDDHSGGLTYQDGEEIKSTFPNATIYVNNIEWDEVRNPNDRTRGTYLKRNWEAVQDQVTTWEDEFQVNDAMTLYHTGGHSNGHSIFILKQGDDQIIHMADLMLTNAHQNPLWVPGLDDYPMDSIAAKQKWLAYAYENNCQFIFYHNPYYAMVQFDKEGKEIVDSLERNKEPLIPFSDDYIIG